MRFSCNLLTNPPRQAARQQAVATPGAPQEHSQVAKHSRYRIFASQWSRRASAVRLANAREFEGSFRIPNSEALFSMKIGRDCPLTK